MRGSSAATAGTATTSQNASDWDTRTRERDMVCLLCVLKKGKETTRDGPDGSAVSGHYRRSRVKVSARGRNSGATGWIAQGRTSSRGLRWPSGAAGAGGGDVSRVTSTDLNAGVRE